MKIRYASLENRYMTQLGGYTLVGRIPRQPKLCLLDSDGACENDLRERMPILAAFLWRSTYRHRRDAETLFRPRPVREAAVTTNPEIVAALTVWGNMEAP